MIRYYEEKNLIIPERNKSGYRLYNKELIKKILFIKKLQGYDFSLFDIKNLLKEEHYEKEFRNKIHSLLEKNERNLQIINKLLAEVESENDSIHTNQYYISTGFEKKYSAISLSKTIHLSEIENFISDFFNTINKELLMPLPPYCVSFKSIMEEAEKTTVEIIQPISDNHINTITLPIKKVRKNFYVKTIHKGSYDSIHRAYEKLYEWIDASKYVPQNYSVERYYIDASEVDSPEMYITEILIPIKNS